MDNILKELIAIKGKSNSGKTSSLKYLMIKCLENPKFIPKHATRYFSYDPKTMINNLKDHWLTKSGNVSDITITFQYKNIIICITSYGDSLNGDILPALDRTIKKFGKCDIFVCGRHSNNDVHSEFYVYNVEHITSVSKERANRDNLYEDENKASADEMYQKLLTAINAIA